MKKIIFFGTRVLIAVMVTNLLICCASAEKTLDVAQLSGLGDLENIFLTHYQPVAEDFKIDMPSYALPLDFTRVSNYDQVAEHYLGSSDARAMLKKNGFVVIDAGMVDDITQTYTRIRDKDVPIYVTADTPLHLFHIQFDETLKDIEERVFYTDMVEMTRAMLKKSEEDYRLFKGEIKEAAKRNVAYFSVALAQFDPEFTPPPYVKDWVDWESTQIEEHRGLTDYDTAREKSLFRVPEDYSQYKPRGHYTRSDKLKQYFKGMMWYGRMTFLLKGHENFGPIIPPDSALTDRTTARIQTLQAILIAAQSGEVKLQDGRTVAEVWNRIYAVTAFYVGFADDLTLYDYREALRTAFGTSVSVSELEEEEKFTQFLLKCAELSPPAIFSGTAGAGLDPGGVQGHQYTSVKHLDDILSSTMGFRFMGQRYIPDSYMLGQLVSPAVGTIPRKIPERFSVVYIPDERIQPDLAYSIRGFPRGLDVFSVLGSEQAAYHVKTATDDEYPKYYEQLETLRSEFAALTAQEWNRNLYWSWLYALKTLIEERGKGYQTYQQTTAWLDRQLTTALASWAALRHNTILYAKQSYTPIHVGITAVQPVPPPPPPPKGIVEPVPSFYARILTTTRMAYSGLRELKVLDARAESRLSALVRVLEQLYDICLRQVENEPLTLSDNEFLANFSESLKNTIGDVDDKGLKTTIIADVHTEMNTKQVLEEASGYIDYILVAYARPEGDIILAVGPVLSYYEFKHPMKDRLTDEKWQDMLLQNQAPDRPWWISSYMRE
jgi:hypothetical protein